jgi:hypothetical protein
MVTWKWTTIMPMASLLCTNKISKSLKYLLRYAQVWVPYLRLKVKGYMCVIIKFEFLFWDFKVTYPPFWRVLIFVLCFFFLNCSLFVKYRGYEKLGRVNRWRHLGLIFYKIKKFGGDIPPHFQMLWCYWCVYFCLKLYGLEDIYGLRFKVTCVSSSNLSFSFEILRWPTPILKVLIVMMCLFFHNCSPFGRYKRYEISRRLNRWRHLRLIFIEFESLEVTYPPFFIVSMLVVCLFLL